MFHAAVHVALEIVVGILVLNTFLALALVVAAFFWFRREDGPP